MPVTSKPFFHTLCIALESSLLAYHDALIKANVSIGVLPGRLEAENGVLLMDGKTIKTAYLSTPSAHAQLTIERAQTELAQSIDALNTAIGAIDVLPLMFREIVLRGNPGSQVPAWSITLESAAVCPSGQIEDHKNSALSYQLLILADKLTAAHATSQTWLTTQPFLIACVNDRGLITPPREVFAPDVKGALQADDWAWWAVPAYGSRALIGPNNTILERIA